jgi:superoxide dismutase, Fe-Mn family
MMAYIVQPLPFKPGRLDGLTERLLVSHYENNYGGAMRRLNAIEQRLSGLDWAAAPVFEINGLKREQLIAANSIILHEAYFDGLGGSGDPAGTLASAIERDFGSVARWRSEFAAMAKAQGGGSGWTLLAWSPRLGRLVNVWAADHTHTLGDGAVVLALDMYEHAYHLDFGAKAGAYVDAFMRNIAWERVGRRYDAALARGPAQVPTDAAEITAEALRDMVARKEDVVVLDVRKLEDLARGGDMLPSAEHRNPEQFEAWAASLPKNKTIVAYCVYGFQVSRDPVAALRERGYDARSLAGGIAAWHAIGAPTVPKAGAS